MNDNDSTKSFEMRSIPSKWNFDDFFSSSVGCRLVSQLMDRLIRAECTFRLCIWMNARLVPNETPESKLDVTCEFRYKYNGIDERRKIPIYNAMNRLLATTNDGGGGHCRNRTQNTIIWAFEQSGCSSRSCCSLKNFSFQPFLISNRHFLGAAPPTLCVRSPGVVRNNCVAKQKSFPFFQMILE